MKFTLKNIGKIKNASIEVKPFTVIAGKNGSGKSFFSKSLFSAIKTYQELEEIFLCLVEDKIKEFAINIFNSPEDIFKRSKFFDEILSTISEKIINKDNNFEEIYEICKNHEIFDDTDFFYGVLLFVLYMKKNEIERENNRTVTFDEVLKSKEFENVKYNKRRKIKIENDLKKLGSFEKFQIELKELLNSDFPKKLKLAFNYLIYSVFKRNILTFDENTGNISLDDTNIEIEANEVKNIKYSTDLLFTKTIFVESPIFVEIIDSLSNLTVKEFPIDEKSNRQEKYKLPAHINDLINQITRYELITIPEEDKKVIEEVAKLIDGNVVYNNNTKEIVFKTKDNDIPIINAASGIKNIGILHLLLNSGSLTDKTLLIWEEPEVNLHPEWQVKVVKVLKALLDIKKTGVFITTHSPFVIKAIEALANSDDEFKNKLSVNLLKDDGTVLSNDNNYDVYQDIYNELLSPFQDFLIKGLVL